MTDIADPRVIEIDSFTRTRRSACAGADHT
jgi:hypothetical protein